MRRGSCARTEDKVIGGEGLGAAERLATIIAEGDDLCLDAHPAEIALEGAGDVGLSAGGEADGEDEDLACMPEQTRGSRVQRGSHRGSSQTQIMIT